MSNDEQTSELIGRESEIAAIDRALARLEAGTGGVILLVGEPGIGKSTLAHYARRAAGSRGANVFAGFCWEAGGAPAYWPWTQILASLLNTLQPDERLLGNLGHLLPGRPMAAAAELQPGQAHFRLLESVWRLLDEMADDSPVLLILEDLHASDTDSLHLLNFLSRHVAGMPLLIIGTFREIEARARDSTEPLWRTYREAEVLHLARLDSSGVRQFLEREQSRPASAEQARRLYETTGGNPLFLNELVGLLSQRQNHEFRLPASIQQVISQQLDLLRKQTVFVLSRAAVLGRQFETDSIQAIVDDSQDVDRALSEALETTLLTRIGATEFQFSHVLHRDVLYLRLAESERKEIHLRYAEFLRRAIEAGQADRWTELAEHLYGAGDEHRREAIEAWRKAGARALDRLAFGDAINSLGRALEVFGEGPGRALEDRFRLLIECAQANLQTGATERGRRYSMDAFDIARALGDPALMCEAALTWGSVIVVARIDADLIEALRDCLEALPESEKSSRALVQARLAGAMQPARDPGVPMKMAYEAIELARTLRDDRVLYQVLRSAISALMDFAPAQRRIPLNEEFGALAEKLGDIPGQFRSNLRLVMDACEGADRPRMNQAIEDCNRLARKIGLPHYLWRAASIRAMAATLDGNFAAASDLLDGAQAYADQIDDLEAKVTLPLQRFTLLIEWDSEQCEPIEQIEKRLQIAYDSGLGDAEFYIKPFIDSHRQTPDSQGATRLLSNRAIIERTLAGNDRFSVARLGELAAIAGQSSLAERAFAQCLPFRDCCTTLGLLGSCSPGPVAWSLGIIRFHLGDQDTAFKYLDQALRIADAMHAPVWKARIHATRAELAGKVGRRTETAESESQFKQLRQQLQLRKARSIPTDTPRPTPAAAAATTVVEFHLSRDGDLWRVSFGGRSTMLASNKGLELLAKLVERPDTDQHVLDLCGAAARLDQGTPGPGLDDQARRDYRTRIGELREELDEVEQLGDAAAADRVREEIDFITRELSGAYGLDGRARQSGSSAERARVNVRRRLKDAFERIGEQLPDAGRYLENTVKTGTYCRYSPM